MSVLFDITSSEVRVNFRGIIEGIFEIMLYLFDDVNISCYIFNVFVTEGGQCYFKIKLKGSLCN